jgi:hypothetical protein
MKRPFLLLACLGALSLAACTGDSALPSPTGKGAIRAINAIKGSPDISFLIEERGLASMGYSQSSTPTNYDDFEYNFNFNVRVAGEAEPRRVATEALKVEADRDHTLVLTGDVLSPTVTVWTVDTRTWGESDTVFEARFAHLIDGVGEIDVHFNPVGTPVAAGQQVTRLSFGEIMDPRDFDEESYIMTITAAGDIDTVYYTSGELSFTAQTAHLISAFAGNESITAPVFVRTMTARGAEGTFPDSVAQPTIRFINSSRALGATDIYSDEILTNQVVENLGFGEVTGDITTTTDQKTFYFTPAGSTAMIVFEDDTPTFFASSHNHVVALGEYALVHYVPERASISTAVRFRIFNGALDNASFDVYLTDRDEALTEESFPRIVSVGFGSASPIAEIAAGNYDVYLTLPREKTELAGPYPVDVALGDVVELWALDTADPNVIEIREIPNP